MKTLKRYKIELFFGQEVGINCAHVEVSTKTKKLGNGPIATDTKGFSVLTAKTKRAVRRALGVWGGADALVSAVCDDQVPGIEEVDVRMVMAGCKTDRPYLYVSASEEFWSEQDLVSFAKEGELLED